MPSRAFLLLLGVLLLAPPVSAQGQPSSLTLAETQPPRADVRNLTISAAPEDTLRGIGPIDVLVENMDLEDEQDGLTKQMLQTAVELRLRQNGIPIDENASPYLNVNVNAMKHDTGLYALCIQVSLKQPVRLVTGLVTTRATTWDVGTVGIGGANNLRQARDAVLDYIDQFSNDYLAVNPQ